MTLTRLYITLMKGHDFDYMYSDDFGHFTRERFKDYRISALKEKLMTHLMGHKIIKRAEARGRC